jgi:hypothetical protein
VDTSSEAIRTILETQWPDECEIVDRATLERIVAVAQEGQTFESAFRSVRGGADWDVQEIIKSLVDAAVLIKTSLEAWKLLTAQMGRKPSKKELTDAIATERDKAPAAVREKLDAIAAKVSELSKEG